MDLFKMNYNLFSKLSKPLAERMRPKDLSFFIGQDNIIKQIENEQLRQEKFDFNVGDTVVIGYKIKEGNRERVQAFEGTVIKKQGKGSRATFTVRRVLQGVGVERTFPIHSPRIESLKVIRRGKVRRAKLYYLRDRVGKASKVKELKKY